MGPRDVGWRRGHVLTAGAVIVVLATVGVGTLVPDPSAGDHLGDMFGLSCLSDVDVRTVGCAPIGMPRDARTEPFLAVHPTDPNVIVVGTIGRSRPSDAEHALGPTSETRPPTPEERVGYAINATSGQGATGPPEPGPRGQPCPPLGLCLHVTEDGGRTWYARSFPVQDGKPWIADPTLSFDDAGSLHAAGHLMGAPGVHYSRTDDLGRTWTAPVQVAPDGVRPDRPWISIDGTAGVLVWQTTVEPIRTQIATSLDGGVSWSVLESFAPSCNLPSAPLALGDGTFLIGCSEQRAFSRLRVFHVDPKTATFDERADIGGASNIPMLSRASDGMITLTNFGRAGLFRGSVLVQTSHDEGRSWSAARDVLDTAKLDDDWDWQWLSWAGTDKHGTVHAIVVGGTQAYCRNQRCERGEGAHEVIWVAADPRSGDVLAEASLGRELHERPADANPVTTDDYHHVVPYGEGVLLAWGHDARVELAVVKAR